ncbi:MAG TPA: GatB/YqeY domain-containing protein [Hellea balneolensis]|uniref:GatB/YqeY domain-containing protein n=1 Tax=Hellea balneolensis TaxID=287478 RepID=A0A7C5LY44_9PROT|nr:GatB/YqeY domain-containing protein [Hellea balneolensis]
MSIRRDLNTRMKAAMKSKDKTALATVRLILAAVKDRDIAARAQDKPNGIDDGEILSLLAKMVKQREESAKIYEENGRLELAENENAEIAIIREFMPTPLSDDELKQAVKEAVDAQGASCLKDMGKVMGALKAKYAGRMDMGKAGAAVKALLMG